MFKQNPLPNMPQKDDQPEWGGYIDVRMNDELKTLFKEWREANAEEVFSWMIDIIITGLKLGCSWDSENQCFVATLNGLGVKGSDKRYTMTARAGNVEEAFALLTYKHYMVLEGDWGNFKPTNRRKQDWG